MTKIPVTVIVVTKNEEDRIGACLRALSSFDQVIVFDSDSTDNTKALSQENGADVFGFQWNGRYPKKRQYALDQLAIRHDWVFFVDADESVTADLIDEIRNIDWDEPRIGGYFVRGRYVFEDTALRFGLQNNKLALIDRHKMMFPVVDDLDIEGMGEIEGHYQPVPQFEDQKVQYKQLKAPLLHHAYEDRKAWERRHKNYAYWEVHMDKRQAWPDESHKFRKVLKLLFKALPARGLIAFLHSYLIKFGFLDGVRGFKFARTRKQYYDLIAEEKRKISRNF